MRKITGLMSSSSSEESKKNTSAHSERLIEDHKSDQTSIPKKKGPSAIVKKRS